MVSCVLTLAAVLLAGAICIQGNPSSNYGQKEDNTTVVYPQDLPTGKADEKFMKLIHAVQHLEKYEESKYGGKRSITGPHWCCKIPTPTQSVSRPVIRSRVEQEIVTDVIQHRCGWPSKICTKTITKSIPKIVHYEDFEYVDAPAERFRNGCPDELIGCCAGYLLHLPHFPNCLTAKEMGEFLTVLIGAKELDL